MYIPCACKRKEPWNLYIAVKHVLCLSAMVNYPVMESPTLYIIAWDDTTELPIEGSDHAYTCTSIRIDEPSNGELI